MTESPEIADDLDLRRKRARYRAWHRGTKELDMILGRFADDNLDRLDMDGLLRFEALLECEEVPLQRVLMGQDAAPQGTDGEMMIKIRQYQLHKARENSNG